MKHIFLTGDSGAGKSTLIRRLLAAWELPYGGFVTKKEAKDESGFHPIYLHPAAQAPEQRQYREENRIGSCDKRIRDQKPGVFDRLGVEYLRGAEDGSVIVMDELGFMEARAEHFKARVLELLEGDTMVLAAVKSRAEVPFLELLHRHPRAELFRVTPDNRDELFALLSKRRPGP